MVGRVDHPAGGHGGGAAGDHRPAGRGRPRSQPAQAGVQSYLVYPARLLSFRLVQRKQTILPEVSYGTLYCIALLVALSATQYISLSVCLFVCSFVRPSVTLFQIQTIILSLLAYSILRQFSRIV